MTIVGTLKIVPLSDRRSEVLEILRSVQGPVLAEPGCTGCHIYEEPGPEQAVVLVERWESEVALEVHIRSEAYRRILGAIELSAAPPEVRFDHVSVSEGMERIEQWRGMDGTDVDPHVVGGAGRDSGVETSKSRKIATGTHEEE